MWERVRGQVEHHNRQGGTCLVPMFVQIENGHSNRSAPRTAGRLFESAGPLIGGLKVFNSRDVAWPQQAASRFSGTLPGGERVHLREDENPKRFLSFTLRAHPGVQAPLGWSLSESAQRDLHQQLKLNQKELQDLYRLLGPGNLSCTGP